MGHPGGLSGLRGTKDEGSTVGLSRAWHEVSTVKGLNVKASGLQGLVLTALESWECSKQIFKARCGGLGLRVFKACVRLRASSS